MRIAIMTIACFLILPSAALPGAGASAAPTLPVSCSVAITSLTQVSASCRFLCLEDSTLSATAGLLALSISGSCGGKTASCGPGPCSDSASGFTEKGVGQCVLNGVMGATGSCAASGGKEDPCKDKSNLHSYVATGGVVASQTFVIAPHVGADACPELEGGEQEVGVGGVFLSGTHHGPYVEVTDALVGNEVAFTVLSDTDGDFDFDCIDGPFWGQGTHNCPPGANGGWNVMVMTGEVNGMLSLPTSGIVESY